MPGIILSSGKHIRSNRSSLRVKQPSKSWAGPAGLRQVSWLRNNWRGPVTCPRRHLKPFVVWQLQGQHVQSRVRRQRMEAQNVSVRKMVPDCHQVLLKIPLAAQLEVLPSGQPRHRCRNFLTRLLAVAIEAIFAKVSGGTSCATQS